MCWKWARPFWRYCRPHIMTVNFIHPLFAANLVAVFTWHVGTSAGIYFPWKWYGWRTVSDQFDPRAYHRPCVGGGDVGCVSTSNFYIPIQQQKSIGFTWLEDGERCFISCSEHISDSFLHFDTIFFCNVKNYIRRMWLSVSPFFIQQSVFDIYFYMFLIDNRRRVGSSSPYPYCGTCGMRFCMS